MRGATRAQLLRKTLGRAGALLVMGIVMVNHEEMKLGPEASWWHRQWGLAAYVAMFLAFAVVPDRACTARTMLRGARLAGIVVLVALALLFRTGDGQALLLGPLWRTTEPVWLRHSWWGILGLIGWAYLAAALLYLLVGRRREWLIGAMACLLLLYFAAAADFAERMADRPWLDGVRPVVTFAGLAIGWINAHVSIGSSLGSLASITMAGCCLGSILADRTDVTVPADRLRWALGFAVGLFVAGLLVDGTYGINKIRATPAWCLYCASLTTAVWVVLYWLMDLRGVRSWGRLVEPAGANPLLAYLLHPLVFLLAGLGGERVSSALFFYKSPEHPALVAVIGSLLMALLIVQATGWVARAGFRLKV
jgi:predicted acyltransferase